MSGRSLALEHATALPPHLRPAATCAVGAARLLTRLSPRRLRRVLELTRLGARPADEMEALRARNAVVAVSIPCAGPRCLQRAIATALLCRMLGCWPEWRIGVRSQPFQAHAWVAVDGKAVGENPNTIGFFHLLMAVPPARKRTRHEGPASASPPAIRLGREA